MRRAHDIPEPTSGEAALRWPDLREKLDAELAGRIVAKAAGSVVTPQELEAFPASVRRYLGFMRVVGKPRRHTFRIAWRGRFRLGPDVRFLPCEAWQYDAADPVTRAFYMKTFAYGVLPTFVRDTYIDGRARMLARAFDSMRVVDVARPELDLSELVTYLNDAVLIAPSFLLLPSVTFQSLDDGTFDVTLVDRGRTVSARVFLDERGAPRDFVTEERYGNDPFTPGQPFVKARWSTPVVAWNTEGEVPILADASAVWHFDRGTFAYAELGAVPGTLAFDVAPMA